MEEQDVRRMVIWAKRVLRPLAEESKLPDLRQSLQEAETGFRETLFSVPENALQELVGVGLMSPIDMLAHFSITMSWQAQHLREIRTGMTPIDEDLVSLFQGAGEQSYSILLDRYLLTWEGLLQEAGEADNVDRTSTHVWFGLLNCKEWIIASTSHFDYHRAQIEAVLQLADGG